MPRSIRCGIFVIAAQLWLACATNRIQEKPQYWIWTWENSDPASPGYAEGRANIQISGDSFHAILIDKLEIGVWNQEFVKIELDGTWRLERVEANRKLINRNKPDLRLVGRLRRRCFSSQPSISGRETVEIRGGSERLELARWLPREEKCRPAA